MPTYDYECDNCGHEFEEWQSFKDEPLTKCPQCKKAKLRRLFGGGAGIIFKGSGFYETDYRRADEAKKSGKGKSNGEAKPAEAKAEAAPAKTEAAPAANGDGAPKTGKGKKAGT